MQAWIIGMSEGWCQGSFKQGTSRSLVRLLNKAMDRQANTELPEELALVIHDKLMSASYTYVTLAHRERSAYADSYLGADTMPEWQPGNTILITWSEHHASQEAVMNMLWELGMPNITSFTTLSDLEEDEEEEEEVEEEDVPDHTEVD